MARSQGGEWLVRIEDLDPLREIPGMADHHLATLAAFGLVSDAPVVRQSERAEAYALALGRLREQDLAFACRCSRSDLAAYAGIHHACVANPSGRHPAWRLRVPECSIGFQDRVRGRCTESPRNDSGDFVLRRADGFWAYQLAVVVDDAEQGITEVVRGADLLDSTPRQILLQEFLDLATPDYTHLPTVLGADGAKLSKSLASAPVDANNPLPALRLAWSLLGQDLRPVADAATADRLLVLAILDFDPRRIPAHDLPATM